MKKHILAGLITSTLLATSIAQASVNTQSEDFHSGLGIAAAKQVQQIVAQQTAAQPAAAYNATCSWHEKEDSLPSDYFASADPIFVC